MLLTYSSGKRLSLKVSNADDNNNGHPGLQSINPNHKKRKITKNEKLQITKTSRSEGLKKLADHVVKTFFQTNTGSVVRGVSEQHLKLCFKKSVGCRGVVAQRIMKRSAYDFCGIPPNKSALRVSFLVVFQNNFFTKIIVLTWFYLVFYLNNRNKNFLRLIISYHLKLKDFCEVSQKCLSSGRLSIL